MQQQPRKNINQQYSLQKQPLRTSGTDIPQFGRYGYGYSAVNDKKPIIPGNFVRQNYVTTSYRTNQQPTNWGNTQIPRINSQNELDPNKNKYIKRKNDGLVSNLKNELQSLKLQVNKLMNKNQQKPSAIQQPVKQTKNTFKDLMVQPTFMQSNYQKYSSTAKYQSYKPSESFGGNSSKLLHKFQNIPDKSDTQSVTSERVIDEPIRQLKKTSANYDHGHYMTLENDLLKTELRNLKNRYNSKKTQLTEKCQALQKKNEYLEISLQKSEKMLADYKQTLQLQIQTIKTQMARKFEAQMKQSKIKYDQLMKNQTHILTSQNQPNEYIEDKFNKLYEDLSLKNRTINNLTIDLNEQKSSKQRVSFELRKQKEISAQLSSQIQFCKRQQSRTHDHLQTEMSKKKQLSKLIQQYKNQNAILMQQLQNKNKMVSGTQMKSSKIIEDLNTIKFKQTNYLDKINELQNKNKKMSQLVEADKIQITHLKKNNQQNMRQIEKLSKLLKDQKENNFELQQKYHKTIEDIKKKQQEKIALLKKEIENNTQIKAEKNSHSPKTPNSPRSQKLVSEKQINEKQKQIRKWKAEYKLLKIKLQQKQALDKNSKQQIGTYYQNYMQFKHKVYQLDIKNKAYQKQIDSTSERLKSIETQFVSSKTKMKIQMKKDATELRKCKKQLKQANDQKQLLSKKVNEYLQRYESQVQYRKSIEDKIFEFQPQQFHQTLQKIKKKIAEQDQKINRYIKQIKNKQTTISALKTQIKQLIQSKDKDIKDQVLKEVQQTLQQFISKKFIFVEQMTNQYRNDLEIQKSKYAELSNQNKDLKTKNSVFDKNSIKLKQQNQSLLSLYNAKNVEMESQGSKFENKKEQFEQRLSQARMEKLQQQTTFQNQIKSKNQEIASLRDQIRAALSLNLRAPNQANFNEALKQQVQNNQKLRQQLNKRNEQVFRLRDSYSSLRSQYDNLKSQIEIIKLKNISQKKNMDVNFQVQMQNVKNSAILQQKKVSSLQQKIEIIVEENKKKDNFIQTYIMGKKLPQSDKQFLLQFVKQYEIVLTGKPINDRLQQQSLQLQKLSISNYNLLKQMAQMKEKLSIYDLQSESQVGSSKLIESEQNLIPLRKVDIHSMD